MKVYKVKIDVNNYASFYIDAPDEYYDSHREMLRFNGKPASSLWEIPPIFILHPKLKRGDFYGFEHKIALSQHAFDFLHDLITPYAELLPLIYQNTNYYALNTINFKSLLDYDKTVWRVNESGERGSVKKFAFNESLLPENMLFKVPEAIAYNFVVEINNDPATEFKARVENAGLKGLIFTEEWSNE
jgi:hypothetical protein